MNDKFWNLIHLMSIIMVLLSMILHLAVTSGSSDETLISIVSAVALLLLWIGLFSYLRGIDFFAWIVKALFTIIRAMIPFLIVVLLFIVSFAVAFRELVSTQQDSDDLMMTTTTTDERNVLRPYLLISAPFGNVLMSILTTMEAVFGGGFDREDLKQKRTELFISSIILMILMLSIVYLIVLNAAISFIGEKFDIESDKKQPNRMLEKAQIILDIMCLFNKDTLKRIESRNRWTSVVVPATNLTADYDEDSDPSLEFIKKSTKEDSNKIKKKVGKVEHEVGEVKDQVGEVKNPWVHGLS